MKTQRYHSPVCRYPIADWWYPEPGIFSHFSYRRKGKDPFQNILNDEEVEKLTEKYRVLVPKKRYYWIETLYSHYAHTHYASQLDETKKILEQKYPDFVEDYEKVVKRIWGHMFNMMIMQKPLVDQYCTWLFDVLFELEKRVNAGEIPDSVNLSFYQGRFYGRISELIFNVWLEHQLRVGVIKKEDVKEIPLISMEKTNWWIKGTSFLKAKFLGKKYGGSF